MICPSCYHEIIPSDAMWTGLQELIACQEHLRKVHGIRKGMHDMLELRVEMEHEKFKPEGEPIYERTEDQ
jgi:hypothetical protein